MNLNIVTHDGKVLNFPIVDKDYFTYNNNENEINIYRFFPYKQDRILIHNISSFKYTEGNYIIYERTDCKDPENKKPSVVDIEFI